MGAIGAREVDIPRLIARQFRLTLRAAFARVIASVGLFQTIRVHMSIDLGRRNIRMAEHRLHRAEISAAFQQMGCERMAQRVRRNFFIDAGSPGVSPNDLPASLATERLTGAIDE